MLTSIHSTHLYVNDRISPNLFIRPPLIFISINHHLVINNTLPMRPCRRIIRLAHVNELLRGFGQNDSHLIRLVKHLYYK